ncbi:MAG: hypothetical protein FWD82_02850 [Defluviitaleaceae bacterium]|nr:hypothetical protein [Defluviitaleaceae bacterium]
MKPEININLLEGFVKFNEIENNPTLDLIANPDPGDLERDPILITPHYGVNDWCK